MDSSDAILNVESKNRYGAMYINIFNLPFVECKPF